ncbi:MAG: hypothetical protein HY769_06840, partial [Candidatus Stahlbacteria bacterium]|nr:hypothetical protein [Candidatus Stahlbacteria bacterium]
MKSNKNICREIRNQKSEVRSQKSFLSLKVVGLVIISILVGCNNPFVPPKPPIPDAPILLRPDDKASFLPDREVTFSWMPTLENILDTKGYQLQISNNKSFSTCVINLTTASRTYKHSFTNMGEYYWRVKLQVKTFNQWSNWSLVRSFKIGLESNSPPVTPHTPSPADNATDVSPILTLGWQ